METTLGEYVRKKRLDRRMTLREFANCVALSGSFISAMENDEKVTLSSAVLSKMKNALNLSPDEQEVYYELASQLKAAKALPMGFTETKHGVVRVALRVAQEMEATDEEWRDFIRRFRENLR